MGRDDREKRAPHTLFLRGKIGWTEMRRRRRASRRRSRSRSKLGRGAQDMPGSGEAPAGNIEQGPRSVDLSL
jgi:hypothetical protein